jgi:sarcosine oxidase, subunit gamma
VADAFLKPLTAFGSETPKSLVIGDYRIVERFDVALASLTTRRGHEKKVAKAANAAKLPLPPPTCAEEGNIFGAFWLSTDQWMIEAPFLTHEDISEHLKAIFGDAASITEQTDAWVRLDISAPQLQPLLERLCNVDLATASVGFATRTVIEHIGCYIIFRSANTVTLYGPRSMAGSLIHILEVTAHSII